MKFFSVSCPMDNIKMEVFRNNEFGSVRIIQEGEKYLFCAKDVAGALGYKDTINAMMSISGFTSTAFLLFR